MRATNASAAGSRPASQLHFRCTEDDQKTNGNGKTTPVPKGADNTRLLNSINAVLFGYESGNLTPEQRRAGHDVVRTELKGLQNTSWTRPEARNESAVNIDLRKKHVLEFLEKRYPKKDAYFLVYGCNPPNIAERLFHATVGNALSVYSRFLVKPIRNFTMRVPHASVSFLGSVVPGIKSRALQIAEKAREIAATCILSAADRRRIATARAAAASAGAIPAPSPESSPERTPKESPDPSPPPSRPLSPKANASGITPSKVQSSGGVLPLPLPSPSIRPAVPPKIPPRPIRTSLNLAVIFAPKGSSARPASPLPSPSHEAIPVSLPPSTDPAQRNVPRTMSLAPQFAVSGEALAGMRNRLSTSRAPLTQVGRRQSAVNLGPAGEREFASRNLRVSRAAGAPIEEEARCCSRRGVKNCCEKLTKRVKKIIIKKFFEKP
ncbi:MAG TPA: hypothetical protein VN457_03790, partial [Chlamydiales bacterium]|nr:hypothetical protein [Chlamydiales bacterium]